MLECRGSLILRSHRSHAFSLEDSVEQFHELLIIQFDGFFFGQSSCSIGLE